ncbi:MAG: hypothetical protein COB67_08875 [SAR324 cluster bacterium]|uniref:Zona occludens toxin N-terminal domain-containing protein n=1 Tax=SAR324 cluster bacterium TaxID=2024889 RepID=A0A2A4T2N6_9DELT|nr:MAG: hypothetical protein COB67_08875 [SAR324 cluster bacterium]
MIKYINGILGGGKTALAVAYIYSIVPNSQIKKPLFKDSDFTSGYKKVYSNISGLNKDDFGGMLEFLNFDIIDKCALAQATLLEASKHIQSIDKVLNKFWDDVALGVEFDDVESEFDLELISYLYSDIKGFQFNHVLIVIDEVADFFDEHKKYMAKWFNYSRHIYQDMILIQNDLTEISPSFKNDKTVKHYIAAADASNRLHPQLFKYAFYDKYTQFKGSKPVIKQVWIPTWIFDKYDCGKPQLAFPKIYVYLLAMFLLLSFLIYNVSSFFDDDPPVMNISSSTSSPFVIDVVNDLRDVVCFRCGKASCVYKNDVFSMNKFTFYKERHNMELAYKEKHFFFTDFCYQTDKEFLEMYEIKDDNNTGSINSFF